MNENCVSWDCESCVYYPPSSCDGKPCSVCDPDDPFLDCYEEAENQKTHILKKEDMYSLYPEKTQVQSYGLDELYPIGIMWFMAFDPNQTDEVPGEWEMVSKLWKRIK